MDTLNVKLQTLDDKTMFKASARDNPQIVIDYFPPVGTGHGYTSLEMLMASFGSCVSSVVMTLLRFRLKKTVIGLTADISGVVREDHPKSLKNINAVLHIKAKDLASDEAAQMLKLAEDSMCPVWAMLKGNSDIDVSIEIENV